MSTMVENSKKRKSDAKTKYISAKSAPVTNGVRSTVKKQRKSVQDNQKTEISVEPEIAADPSLNNISENSSSQKNGVPFQENNESENINATETVQESSGSLKRVPSFKRKIPQPGKHQKQVKTDSQIDINSQNNIPVLVEPKNDLDEMSVLKSNKEASRSLKRVPSVRKQNLSCIGEDEESSKTSKSSETKNGKLPSDGQLQKNQLKRNPSIRGGKELPENEESDRVEAKLEVPNASRAVKRVPSIRKKNTIIANKNQEETIQPTSDVQEDSNFNKNIPEIHVESENDQTETQPKSKTSRIAKRSSSIRTTKPKKDTKNSEVASGDISESSKLQENVLSMKVGPENNEALMPESIQEPTKSLKGVSPRKRKAPVVNEKSKSVKLTELTENIQEPSTSQKVPKTAKRQKFQELPIPPINSIHGTVFVMGDNDSGQLGLLPDAENNGVERKSRPFQLELPYSIVEVAAGGMHSVCLTTNGEVITFGCNDEGALGRITDDDSPEYMPKKVDIPERIVQISAADCHTAALSESGQVYIWGNFRGVDGVMGLTRNGLKQISPMKILQEEKVVMISSGCEHLICLSSSGVVYSCGAGENGQLGRLSSRSAQKGGRGGLANLVEPAQLHVTHYRKPLYMDKVWTGAYNTFLREKETGSIYACGLNNYCQLGFSSTETVYVPKKVESFDNNVWEYIRGGQHHTLTLDESGKVYSIGRKEYGRLGLGENCDDQNRPTIIPTLEAERCIGISSGNVTSFAVTEEGSAFSWGLGYTYELGHGNDDDYFVPTEVRGRFQESWKAIRISGGGQHALILACRKEKADDSEK